MQKNFQVAVMKRLNAAYQALVETQEMRGSLNISEDRGREIGKERGYIRGERGNSWVVFSKRLYAVHLAQFRDLENFRLNEERER